MNNLESLSILITYQGHIRKSIYEGQKYMNNALLEKYIQLTSKEKTTQWMKCEKNFIPCLSINDYWCAFPIQLDKENHKEFQYENLIAIIIVNSELQRVEIVITETKNKDVFLIDGIEYRKSLLQGKPIYSVSFTPIRNPIGYLYEIMKFNDYFCPEVSLWNAVQISDNMIKEIEKFQ